MKELTKFLSMTVQFYMPNSAAGVEFYTKVFNRPPNFAPLPDFHEWDHLAPNVTFQLAGGPSRPTYPIRFGVENIDGERLRIIESAKPQYASPIKRFEGIVATCDFIDPWGNTFGLYQLLAPTGQQATLEGVNQDHRTEVENYIASGETTSQRKLDFIERLKTE